MWCCFAATLPNGSAIEQRLGEPVGCLDTPDDPTANILASLVADKMLLQIAAISTKTVAPRTQTPTSTPARKRVRSDPGGLPLEASAADNWYGS